jgi:hypothetical protein
MQGRPRSGTEIEAETSRGYPFRKRDEQAAQKSPVVWIGGVIFVVQVPAFLFVGVQALGRGHKHEAAPAALQVGAGIGRCEVMTLGTATENTGFGL